MKEQKTRNWRELKELASKIVNMEWKTVDTVETGVWKKTYNCTSDCSPYVAWHVLRQIQIVPVKDFI